MKLIFIGDIVGNPGRKAVKELLPLLKLRLGLDFVIANGENAAGGAGITINTANELFDAGVNVITSGDHLWDQKEVVKLLESEPRFLRPLNYPNGVPGKGSNVFNLDNGTFVAVMNLQGRVFMDPIENPFQFALKEVEQLRQKTNIIIVDFHAEATSEKIAMGWMLDGKVSAVLGTHTHVQTADEQILPNGTAFISDVGFTGPHESVIGREIEPIIARFLTHQPRKCEVAKGNIMLKGVYLEIDEKTGKAISIQRISESLPSK